MQDACQAIVVTQPVRYDRNGDHVGGVRIATLSLAISSPTLPCPRF